MNLVRPLLFLHFLHTHEGEEAMFFVGQRVVCIAGHPEWAATGARVPAVGAILTIRAIDATAGLLFEEIVNEPVACFDAESGVRIEPAEDSFWQHRFRPLVECETDIAVFRRILDRVNAKKEVTLARKRPQDGIPEENYPPVGIFVTKF
jgi:hypothetical protein